MTVATFGDLLGLGCGHLDAAAEFAGAGLRSQSVIAAARVTGRLALTLSHYLDDIAPYSVDEAITNSDLDAPMRAAVDGREALRLAAESLCAGDEDDGAFRGEPSDPLAAQLGAAATLLAAGRDLLRTHFITGPDEWPQHRDWAAVISSVPVTRALLAEVASWSRQLAFLTGWLSVVSAPDPAIPEPVRQGLAGAHHWLLTGSAAIAAGQRDDRATAADTELMHAIPVSLPPEPQPPQDLETVAELAAGVAVSAARLRVIAQAAPEEAAWSTVMTAESWRWKATGAAVLCHLSELILRSLADHPDINAVTSAVAPRLGAAAEAAADACARWREVAAAWSQMTTESRGLTAPGIADTGDLLLRLGRLAFTDPQWTPIRSRRAALRDRADLAPDTAQAAVVVGALHHAADTLAWVGAADLQAVDVAIRARRIYAPTRTLPEYYDVPYRYGHATPADTAALIEAYDAASGATDCAVRELDALAVTMKAPTRVLAAARAAARLAQYSSTLNPETADQPVQPLQPGRRAAAPTPQPRQRPGSVEQAVRSAGSPDVVLLMRARAIDKLADKLIAEAKKPSHDIEISGPAHEHGRPAPPPRNPARVAAENFPRPPTAKSMARRLAEQPVHHCALRQSAGRRQTESRRRRR